MINPAHFLDRFLNRYLLFLGINGRKTLIGENAVIKDMHTCHTLKCLSWISCTLTFMWPDTKNVNGHHNCLMSPEYIAIYNFKVFFHSKGQDMNWPVHLSGNSL